MPVMLPREVHRSRLYDIIHRTIADPDKARQARRDADTIIGSVGPKTRAAVIEMCTMATMTHEQIEIFAKQRGARMAVIVAMNMVLPPRTNNPAESAAYRLSRATRRKYFDAIKL